MTLSDDAVVKASGAQVSSEVNGEAVTLNLKSGVYFSLNAVGSRIWQLLQKPSSVGDIRAVIEREYEVEAEQCERDVMSLLNKLASKGLIEVHAANTA
jgi:hypothetical protein